MALSRKPLRRTSAKRSGKAYRRTDVSESAWRAEVLRRDGYRCRGCGLRDVSGRRLSAHHVIFKSHCADEYVTDRRNGLTLCNEWGKGCHQAVHGGRLKVSQAMMPPEVRTCVEEQGLTYDEDGHPWGPCRKYFAQEAKK